jgi:hypothetical protein
MTDLRISGIEAIKDAMDKYSSSNADFFSIQNDEEVAKVRFAHGDDKDLDIYVVHKVKIAGKDRYVACLAPSKQPCPLCQAGHRPTIRMFLSVLDTRDNKKKIWDRGKSEIPNILGLITRYGRLDGRYCEIQRHGKKGDKETKYQFFPLDPIVGEDPIERDPIVGETAFVLQKDVESMKQLIQEIDINAPTGFNSQPQSSGATGKMF